ncbi:MAG: YegS/Rv2252/BmrU family lipid kinase [Acidimicrobiia bacterium]|nr:YegS/Rv2252/BmrU family lipid kinase [Acidimicrobiia bacterium]
MNPWQVLVNPRAARGRSATAQIEALLEARSVPAEVVMVDGRAMLQSTIRAAAAAGRHRLVAAGGDGTVNLVVNEIMAQSWETPPLLGIIPAGSGCDLLRTFGIGSDIHRAVDRLIEGSPYPVDVGLAIGEWGRRYFLNVASVGATASTAQTALRLPGRLGPLRYVAGVAVSFPGWRHRQVQVETVQRRFSGNALTVVAANAQFFGGGFNVAPRASMVDGLLDVQIFTCSKKQVAALMRKVKGGNHLADPAVKRLVASEARIETDQPWPVEVDGEPIGQTPLLVRLGEGRINLMV